MGNIVHILNRGVEKRKIFLDDEDYSRFVNNLDDFNNTAPVPYSYYARRKYSSALVKPKRELVAVLCFCLMPNHYHVLAEEKIGRGSGAYAKKFMSGYTQYFNLKHDRKGVLFQGKSKLIVINHDEHFLHIPYYIFANPIKLIEPKWREAGPKDLDKIIKFLEDYKWSNYASVIGAGKQNPYFAPYKKAFFELFDTNEKKFKKDFAEWLFGFAKF